jgi:FAD/FMN-containing dehydrogenase
MRLSGWGKYPVIESEPITPLTASGLKSTLGPETGFSGIARGMGRSYGDSSLAPKTINTLYLNHILGFDQSTGIVRCAAGITLADLLQVFVLRGWFLPVTPGTRFVTVGGAIASDVHGKNHHVEGSFCDHVESFRLMLASGDVVDCSKEEHQELFCATCGGMGLTGIILDATFKLKPVKSTYIHETTLKANNLEEALALFEKHNSTTYSVAWIDCLSTGRSLGRSLLMLGEHAEDGRLDIPRKSALSVPVDMPGFLLNRFSISAFNTLYYNRVRKDPHEKLVHYEPFFYPLDSIHHWNRIYGKRGFTQYQFVIPREAGVEGMTAILKKIADSRRGSFLAVLKTFGKGNNNHLSFPMEGYTLALDFKLCDGLFKLLDELDRVVLDYAGRLYLSKDVRMSEDTFKQGYPRWEEFRKIRHDYGADQTFHSLQSERLGI